MGTHNFKCYLLPRNSNVNSSSLARLQMMMQYTFELPTESISLLDIAKVGSEYQYCLEFVS